MEKSIADMVEVMLARGVPSDLIILAVRVAESKLESGGSRVDAAERRRDWDREYRRRKRESGGMSGGMSGGQEDIHLTVSEEESGGSRVECRVDTNPTTSFLREEEDKKEVREERKKEAPQKRGAKLPSDWVPSEKHFLAGEGLGFSAAEVESMAEDLRLWARANEHRQVARKSDWHSTFSAWMRRQSRGPPGMNGQVVSIKDRKQQEWDNARAAVRRVASGEQDSNDSCGSTFGFLSQIGSE